MTSEKHLLISPKDILKLGFECPHCCAIYTVPIDKLDKERLLSACPNCHEGWASEQQPSADVLQSDMKITRMLLDCLKLIQHRPCGAYMRFEIADATHEGKV